MSSPSLQQQLHEAVHQNMEAFPDRYYDGGAHWIFKELQPKIATAEKAAALYIERHFSEDYFTALDDVLLDCMNVSLEEGLSESWECEADPADFPVYRDHVLKCFQADLDDFAFLAVKTIPSIIDSVMFNCEYTVGVNETEVVDACMSEYNNWYTADINVDNLRSRFLTDLTTRYPEGSALFNPFYF